MELTFLDKKLLSPMVWEFRFQKPVGFSYLPGQFIKVALEGLKSDRRGNSRYFTLASSPTEKDILLLVKFSPEGSAFKNHLSTLKKGEKLSILLQAGEFILPDNQKIPLVFIAGGIAVVPYRSMVRFLIDKNQQRSVMLFYAARRQEDWLYSELWQEAEKTLGMKSKYLLTGEEGKKQYLTESSIKELVVNWQNSCFYLSGPRTMVISYFKLLLKMGISREMIISDYFWVS